MRRRFAIGTVATMLLVAAGCGGDKAPPKPPKGTDTNTPRLDIDLDPAAVDKGKSDAGKSDAGKSDAGKSDAGKSDAGKTPEGSGKTSAAPATGGDGFGTLEITFKSDTYIEPKQADGVAGANCGVDNVQLEDLVIDKDTLALANVVVWLDEDEPKLHPDLAALESEKVVLDNLKCRFEPHITTLWTKQTLEIGNKDQIGHNSKIDAFDNESINPVIPPGSSVDAKFPNPESVPMAVSCNIHRWMKGYVVVKPHPYVAVSNTAGVLSLKVPAGGKTFRAWHESGYLSDLKLDGADATWKKGRFDIDIPDGGTVKMSIVIAADKLQ